MRRWWDRAALGMGWCALAAGVVGLVLHFGAWGWQPLVLLASGATYLMGGAVAGLLLCLIARGWRSAVVAGVVVAGVLWTLVPGYVPDGRAGIGTRVTVMQSNLLFGGADVDVVVRTVRDEGVDVLTVEELTVAAVGRLADAGIGEVLPYRYVEPTEAGGGGTGIYSRYPLRDNEKYDGFILNNLSATMEHPQRGPIPVFAFHPIPPSAEFAAWTKEMRAIREILDRQQGSAIVGADFNATRDHSAFRDLLQGSFAAAADQTGAGLLLTFPADRRWGPVIGIDHVLVAGGTTETLRSITIPASDHRALLARVWLNQ